VNGNAITKNSGCSGCWDAGAISQQVIASGNGYVEFKASANAYLTVGLSNGNASTQANDIKFGLRFSPGYVEVRESGAYKADWKYVSGAVYRIAVDGGKVKYYENGTLKYTSTQTPAYPLLLDSTVGTLNTGVQSAVIGLAGSTTTTGEATGGTTTGGTTTGGTTTGGTTTGGTTTGGTTTGGTTTSGPQNVVWASPVKVAVSGNAITKNTGCNGCWDAGAVSQQLITTSNGSVQFKASANAYMTVGLSNGNASTQANDIKFGLRFSPGFVEVRESGVYKADWRYTAGAVYKVAVENGKVKYYENGTLKYTSAQAPAYPLLIDSTIGTVGAGVQNAVIVK
jgi:hypothetical protein